MVMAESGVWKGYGEEELVSLRVETPVGCHTNVLSQVSPGSYVFLFVEDVPGCRRVTLGGGGMKGEGVEVVMRVEVVLGQGGGWGYKVKAVRHRKSVGMMVNEIFIQMDATQGKR